MDYISVAEARERSGLRLVLTIGMPANYCEAAKAVFKLRNVGYTAVVHQAMEQNEELRAWTGVRNAPVAIYNDEPPAITWLEVLLLAERLGSGPSLLPEDPIDRALSIGFTAELASPGGLAWSNRVRMLAPGARDRAPGSSGATSDILRDYGVRDDEAEAAPGRIRSVLKGLADQLHRQQAAGSDYLVGKALSVCDIYWANFSTAFTPLAQEDCPMPEWMQAMYKDATTFAGDLDPILMRHRDMVFKRHIGVPLEF